MSYVSCIHLYETLGWYVVCVWGVYETLGWYVVCVWGVYEALGRGTGRYVCGGGGVCTSYISCIHLYETLGW